MYCKDLFRIFQIFFVSHILFARSDAMIWLAAHSITFVIPTTCATGASALAMKKNMMQTVRGWLL